MANMMLRRTPHNQTHCSPRTPGTTIKLPSSMHTPTPHLPTRSTSLASPGSTASSFAFSALANVFPGNVSSTECYPLPFELGGRVHPLHYLLKDTLRSLFALLHKRPPSSCSGLWAPGQTTFHLKKTKAMRTSKKAKTMPTRRM